MPGTASLRAKTTPSRLWVVPRVEGGTITDLSPNAAMHVGQFAHATTVPPTMDD